MEKPKGFDNIETWFNRHDQYLSYLDSEAWTKLRNDRLLIDGFKCVICGNPNSLQVHHIIYPRILGTETIQDLITLCSNCHSKLEELKDSGTIEFRAPKQYAELSMALRFASMQEYNEKKANIEKFCTHQSRRDNAIWVYAFVGVEPSQKQMIGRSSLRKYKDFVSELGEKNVAIFVDKHY